VKRGGLARPFGRDDEDEPVIAVLDLVDLPDDLVG